MLNFKELRLGSLIHCKNERVGWQVGKVEGLQVSHYGKTMTYKVDCSFPKDFQIENETLTFGSFSPDTTEGLLIQLKYLAYLQLEVYHDTADYCEFKLKGNQIAVYDKKAHTFKVDWIPNPVRFVHQVQNVLRDLVMG